MQYIENEIKIKIFKYVKYPLNLSLTCQDWSVIAKDPYAKTEWLLVHYRKAHALYHAVRLGPTFIDIPVCQALIARKVFISKYFIQRLLMHFRSYDSKLIQFETEHNVGQLDADRIRAFQQKIKSFWENDLSLSVLAYLLDKGHKQLVNTNEELYSKEDVMKLFHFLSAVYHVINHVKIQKKNLKYLNDLTLNKQFIPFHPKPKALQIDFKADPHIYQPHEYSSKGGCENGKPTNLTKFDNFSGQGSFLSFQTTPITVLTLRVRPLRNINQMRRRNQLRRRRRNRRQINVPTNNEDIISLIASLPQQPITNDPFINQFFNGSSFI
ncbi:unnamed protein product [Rhizophagus irregularis]|nr:unnamed protein product [Rhizophagus irregularis]